MKLTLRNDGHDIEDIATDMETIANMIREGLRSGETERTIWDLTEE